MAEVEMDPELALGLFEEGATLVLLGVPEGTELGIDYNTWQVGPRFRGVKMIPPGLHFLHYSASNRPARGGEVGPRTGVFLNLKPRDIRLARWDGAEEDLDFSNSQEEEVERVRAGLRDLDRFLGPYPYGTLRKWVSLTDRMTEEGVRSLQPLSGKICAFSQVLPELALRHTQDRLEQNLPSYDSECHSMQEGLERLPKMKQRPGTEMRFSEIPKQNYPEGATPAQITRCSMDLSYALQSVIDRYYKQDPQQILGELQFAFVSFLIGNVYESFEHWQKLVNLLCRSEEAMQRHLSLYLNLISVLYHQLGEIPPDFFVDIVSKDNFLTSTLQEFFSFAAGPTEPEFSRSSLMTGGGGQGGSSNPWLMDEPEETRGLGFTEIKQQQQRIIEAQDAGLDALASVLSRQKQMGQEIGNELDEHNEIIDDLAHLVDKTDNRIRNETRRVKLVEKKSASCGMLVVIVLLLIAIVVVAVWPTS